MIQGNYKLEKVESEYKFGYWTSPLIVVTVKQHPQIVENNPHHQYEFWVETLI